MLEHKTHSLAALRAQFDREILLSHNRNYCFAEQSQIVIKLLRVNKLKRCLFGVSI